MVKDYVVHFAAFSALMNPRQYHVQRPRIPVLSFRRYISTRQSSTTRASTSQGDLGMNRNFKLAVAIAAFVSGINLAPAADKIADATLDLSGGTVAAGVGYTWGRGTLHYRGRDYPFSVNGLTLINVGAEKVEATAEVYNLSKLEDFAGKYSGLAAGAALVYGASTGVIENSNGVVIRVHAGSQGADLQLAGNAVEVKLR
jgi:hypothetical protein